MLSFAQQTEKKTIHVTPSSHLKKFLKLNEKQKQGILVEPLTVKEYPRQITLSDSLRKGLSPINSIKINYFKYYL